MKIYQVIIEDRHYDVRALPFADSIKATAYAKKFAQKQANRSPGRRLQETFLDDHLYYARWCAETDCVRVKEEVLR